MVTVKAEESDRGEVSLRSHRLTVLLSLLQGPSTNSFTDSKTNVNTFMGLIYIDRCVVCLFDRDVLFENVF